MSFGNTSGTKQRSEIIIFIKTQLIRNSVDAGAVTEEFREKLQMMRSARSVVSGDRRRAGPGTGHAAAEQMIDGEVEEAIEPRTICVPIWRS